MGEFTVYIIKSSVAIALFFLFYKLFLSRETFHRFNRILLLVILIAAFFTPFIDISLKGGNGVVSADYLLSMISAENISEGTTTTQSSPLWVNWVISIYFSGMILSLLYLLWTYIQMKRIMKRESVKIKQGRIKVFITEKEIAPFSWLNSVVICKKDYESEGDIICLHEMAHIKNRHSIDIILSHAAIMLQWFNPAIYLIKQELQAIHEYEADGEVINHGIDAKKYQLLLIRKAVGQRLYNLANSFNHGKLKKRISMMVREKSRKRAALKALFILPAAALAVLVFASEKVSAKADLIAQAEFIAPQNNPQPAKKVIVTTKDTSKTHKKMDVMVISKSKAVIHEKDSVTKMEVMVTKHGEDRKIFINGKEISKDSLKDYLIHVDTAGKSKHMTIRVVGYKNDGEWEHKDSKVTIVKRDSGEQKHMIFMGDADNSSIKVGTKGIISSDVLIIVDGKEVKGLEGISPDKIKSMSVLKDKAAIEKYGEKGAKGVIEITTKMAK